MPSISGCTSCAAGAWINATNIVSRLPPREPGLIETIRDGQAAENHYSVPQFTTIEGMFAIINAFRLEQTETDIRSDEELIQDDLFTQTFLQYPNSTLNEFVFTIVDRSDSNDEKTSKILRWVVANIAYKTDEAVWGRKEMWQPPAVTLETLRH